LRQVVKDQVAGGQPGVRSHSHEVLNNGKDEEKAKKFNMKAIKFPIKKIGGGSSVGAKGITFS
jgi:hypothetical protein